jgi:hypothetical protein
VPFVDRFALPYGADVQAAIADALEDHAFLLLLETPNAHSSDWVFDEVDYALSHAMGMVIAAWPGDVAPVPGSIGMRRFALAPADVRDNGRGYEVLTDEALDRLVAEIESEHARGLVRRRRALVQNIIEAAKAAAISYQPLPDWRLLISGSAGEFLVGTAPRLPNAHDLQQLDEARLVSGTEAGVLVHSARQLGEPLAQHLDWVVSGRQLSLAPENAVASLFPRP